MFPEFFFGILFIGLVLLGCWGARKLVDFLFPLPPELRRVDSEEKAD